ncbi:MAG: hypothetical protein KAH03_08295 [Cocleimonas sp.]|nr:hypothetical protein [Cocleimonas sp.]
MFNKSSQTPLIVELMDISKQNEAILKFFISGVGSKVFKISNTASEVEAYIIDYDFPGAQAHWDENYTGENKPRIILATNDPQASNSVWVGKPLSSKKLIEAAATVKNLLENPQLAEPSISTHNERVAEKTPDKPELKPFSLGNETKMVVPKKRSTVQGGVATATLVTSESLESASSNGANHHLKEKTDTSKREIDEVDHAEIEQQSKNIALQQQKTQEKKAVEAAKQERRWKELCGERNDTSTHKADDLKYIPENHFIGKLTGAVRLAKQSQQIVEIKVLPYSVFILPNEHQVFTELSIDDENFIEFSRDKIKQGDMNIHILSSIETGKLEMQMSNLPKCIHSLESFLWTSSLLASHGRLPITLDLDKKTALKYWPSFARIEAFPYSMRIAALWHHSPDTLVQMAEKLAVPQRYVFAFYNGADALDLIERDPKKVRQQIKAQPKKKGTGLISRLFKRLLGGGATSS